MKKFSATTLFRLGLMLTTLLAVVAVGLFNARWATPAFAEGTVTGAGGGSQGVAGPSGACEEIEQTLSGAENVTQNIDLGLGSTRLLSNQAGIGTGTVRPLTIPIVEFTAQLVSVAHLHTSPAGWTVLGCGIHNSAKVSGGDAATYVINGQAVCFDVPVGAEAVYDSLRIAYYDTTLERWVFLKSTTAGGQVCHSSFRLLPTTFGLFGM